MIAFALTTLNVELAKRALRTQLPEARSSYLTEALARALGFRTHAALLVRLAATPHQAIVANFDRRAFAPRLAALEGSRPQLSAVEKALRTVERELPGIFYEPSANDRRFAYRGERALAWRNLMVAGINAGLEQGLLGLRAGDNRWPGHDDRSHRGSHIFRFEVARGVPALGAVSDAGFDELSIRVIALPTPEGARWAGVSNVGFIAGEAVAHGWLERRRGAYLQSSRTGLKCRRDLTQTLARIDVAPRGYRDRGPFIL